MNSPIEGKVEPFGVAVDLLHEFLNAPLGDIATEVGPMPNLRKLSRNIGDAISEKVDGEIGGIYEVRDQIEAASLAVAENAGRSDLAAERAHLSSQNAQASSRTATTWDFLSGLTPTVIGEGAEVLDADMGEHTDPSTSATVPNAGRYRAFATTLGAWLRIGGTGLSGKAAADRASALEFERTFVRDCWVKVDGTLQPDDTWGTTPLLPIGDLSNIDFKLWGHPLVWTIAWYDEDRTILGGYSADFDGQFLTPADMPAPPAAAKFVTYTHFRTQQALEYWKASTPETRAGMLELAKFPRRGYYHPDGRFEIDNNWVTTDLLPLARLAVHDLCLVGHPAASSVSFFDVNHAFIAGTSAAYIGAVIDDYPEHPEGAAFVAFTANFQRLDGLTRQRVSLVDQPPTRERIRADFARYATEPGFIKTDGTDNSGVDTNWVRSDFIECEPGDQWDVDMTGHPAVSTVAFYDSTQLLLSRVSAAAEAQPGAQVQRSVVAPAGTAYVRFCHGRPVFLPSALYQNQVAYGSFDAADGVVQLRRTVKALSASAATKVYTSPRRLILAPTDKVQLYGDSISSTDYPWYKSALEELTGAQVYNDGFSGFNAMALAVDAQLDRIWTRGARVVIAMVGGNDTGAAGTVGTFDGSVAGEPTVSEAALGDNFGSGSPYFIQAVAHIMRRFRAHYDDIRTRAGLTGSETEAEKTAKIDAVLKPILAFATPLPQKRNNDADPFSRPENWERKRRAVLECCARYKVTCIDLCDLVGWDMAAEPFFVPPTDIVTNNGVYTMDGLHPNKWGARRMAEIDGAVLGIEKRPY